MEKLEEGSKKSVEEDAEKSSNHAPPWIDLLDSLIELIMEKLPLVDYIRCGAICKRWYSIQRGHHLGHSPKPPRMAASVFLVNYKHYWDGFNWEYDRYLLCHPFKVEKKIRLQLPYSTLIFIFDTCSGWILTYHRTSQDCLDKFNIHNPVTGVMVQLPQFAYWQFQVSNGSMSAAPTDPNCCIIISTYHGVFVHRLGELSWKKVQVTHSFGASKYFYFNGMFHRISSSDRKYSLYAVDPFLVEPMEHCLEIDNGEIVIGGTSNFGEKFEKLVDIDGQLYLVLARYLPRRYIKKGFLLFKANFTTRKWMRVTSIGDYAILLSDNAISLLADSVEQFKKNMIYFTQKFYMTEEFRVAWMTFDMDSEQVVEGPSFLHDTEEYDFENELNVHKNSVLFWFFPTL